ncbi:MAG: P27 family phage terminase small subunit [Actinomycetota bacterium]
MAKAGRTRKAEGRRHGHHKPAIELVPAPAGNPKSVEPVRKVPTAPRGILPATRKQWRAYWKSDVSVIVRESDKLGVVTRYFRLADLHARILAALFPEDEHGDASFELFVSGSAGQVRSNPAIDRLIAIEKQLLSMEGELGLTPLARARLGISIGEANEKADAMNRRIRDQARRRAEESAARSRVDEDGDDENDVEFLPA